MNFADCKNSLHMLKWDCFYLLCFLAALVGPVLFTGAMLNHAINPDLPWILRAGEYIIEHQRIPAHDIFSWTFPDRPWVLYQWLFEVKVAILHRIFGEQTFVRLFILLVLTVYLALPLLFGRLCKIPAIFTLLVSSIALITISINMSIRPMVITSLFIALHYLLISRFRCGKLSFKRLLLYSVIIYVLWGNSHTAVMLGIFPLIALIAIGDLMELKGWYRFSPINSEIEGQPVRLKFYIILALTCFLASLINPYGVEIYSYLVNLSSQNYMNDAILELQSPNFHLLSYRVFLILFGLFILLMSRAQKIFAAHEVILLLVFTIAMLFVQRFVVWACLLYVLILPKALYHGFTGFVNQNSIFYKKIQGFEKFTPIVITIFTIGTTVFMFLPKYFPSAHYGKCEPDMNAIEAYQALKQPTDRVLNDAEIGSCTLLRYPEQKVFMDTRFDFYGQDFMQETRMASSLQSNWKVFLKKWQINTIMMKKIWPLARLMAEQPEYKTIYEDKGIIILRKSSSDLER